MNALEKISALLKRHLQTFWYVVTVIAPIILRTGRRPVVFSKYSGIGDIICTFPAALELKKRHPGATFIYNCHKPYGCLPVMAGITSRVTHLRQAGMLRYWYGWLCDAFYEFPSADEGKDSFCSDYLANEYAKNHKVEIRQQRPTLMIPDAALIKASNSLKRLPNFEAPFIVIHPGPTWPIKEWPRSSWQKLVTELKAHGYSNIIQVGTSHHLALDAVNVPVLSGVESLVDQLTLEECVAVIAQAKLLIAVDSGLAHIAAALKTPCLGIFGPTNPSIILPPEIANESVFSRIQCRGCHHQIPRIHWETGCPHDIRCMKMISVDEVLAACLKALFQKNKNLA